MGDLRFDPRAEVIEIEDLSDCPTCLDRERRYGLEFMAECRFSTIGPAWCHDCGREYEAITIDESPEGRRDA